MFQLIACLLKSLLSDRTALAMENLALRQQLAVYEKAIRRPKLTNRECLNHMIILNENHLCRILKDCRRNSHLFPSDLFFGRDRRIDIRQESRYYYRLEVCMLKQSYRYVVEEEGVRSGHPSVAGTRIGVHDVAGMVLNGSTIDDVVRSMSSLSRAQVYECMAYYEDHKAEMDHLIARQMAEAGD